MNTVPVPPLNNTITKDKLSWVWHNYFSSLDRWLQTVVPANVAAIEADIAALEAAMVIAQADIDALQADMLLAQADINVLQFEMITAQDDIAALEQDIIRLEPSYGGIRKTVTQTIGTLSAAFVTITDYQENIFTYQAGITSNLPNGTLTVLYFGDYYLNINLSITFTAIASGGRTFSVRLFDVNSAVEVGSITVFVGKDAEGSTVSLSAPQKILTNSHSVRLEVGEASSNFANFEVNGVTFSVNKISAQ